MRRTKNTYLGALSARLAARRGVKAAAVAVGHRILVTVYYLLPRGEAYRERGAASEVQRRVREQLGERETVARAVRHVLRSFVDWGTLRDAQRPGAYAPREPLAIDDRRLAAWLVEAALLARGADAAGMRSLAQAPALFPFRVRPPSAADLASHPRLELLVQGLAEQMVARR